MGENLLARHTPTVIDEFGGLCTLYDKSDLPIGLAGYATNIEFFPGGFRSRSPFALQSTDSSAFTGLLGYTTAAGLRKRMLLETDGSLKQEYPEGTLTSVSSILGTSLTLAGTRMYGRALMCFSNGKYGTAPPLQYNDTALRRVSIAGPGIACAAAGSATAGSVSTGYHYFAVAFLTDTGYLTRPSPWVELNVTVASRKVDISALAIGPTGTTARVIFATAAYASATTGPVGFYNLPAFVVPDNSTTTLTIDFTDAQLLDSLEVPGDQLYRRDVIPEVLGCCHYNQRVVYWGAVNMLQEDSYWNTLVNFSFDGGFTAGIPNSWTSIVAGVTSSTPAGAVGGTIRLTGDGATATIATIESGVVSRPDVPSGLTTGTAYSVRLRMRRSSAFSTGGASVRVLGVSPTATLDIPVSSISTTWAMFDGALFTSAMTYTTSTRVRVGLVSAAAVTGADYVEINYVEIFPTAEPYQQDTLLVSDIGDPEAVDTIAGRVLVAPDDGDATRACFVLRQNLYVGKEHSTHSVTDVSESPSEWSVAEVDSAVGVAGVNAVKTNEGLAALVDRAGAYLYDGGLMQKISTEIDGTWRAIDKTILYKSWVTIDPRLRRIYFAVPTTQSLVGKIMTMDFVEGLGNPITSPGHERKWSEWQNLNNYAAGEMEERDNGELVFAVAGNTSIGTNYISTSTNFAFAPWTTNYTAWTVTAGQSDPLGGTSATRWQAGAAGPNNAKLASALSSLTYKASVWIRTNSGTITDANVLDADGLPTITTTWKRFFLAVSNVAPVTIDLEFPTGTPDIYVFGVQVQGTSYDQGYVATSGATVTSGGAPGVLARLVDLSTYESFVDSNDFNAALAPRYETAQMGLPIGRSQFAMAVIRVSGNGSLAASLVNQSNTNDSLPSGSVIPLAVVPMRDGRLTSASKEDIELWCNETETTLAVRLETENNTGQFSVKTLALFSTKSPYAYLRMHN